MLKRESAGKLLVLRIDNPTKRNAWNSAMRDEVRLALVEADRSDAVAAVVLTGTGPDAFCAGADLSEASVTGQSESAARMQGFRDLYWSLQSFRKPIVSALNGMALGSAFQAILLTDRRVAHRGVRLGMPEVKSGIPCITGSSILSWVVGANRARELATTGRFIDGEEGHRLGLIDELVESDQVFERACEVADELASLPATAYAETKLWFRDQFQASLTAAFEHAAQIRRDSSIQDSMRFGIEGFFSSRHANGEGKQS